MRLDHVILFAFIGLLLGRAPVAASQQSSTAPATPLASVTLIATPITLDGALDEAGWRSAPTIGDLVQRQPNPARRRPSAPKSRSSTTRTTSTSASSPTTRSPDGSSARRWRATAAFGSDDRIEILLDTFRDQRSAFYFATNPSGALVDGLAFANGQLNTDWDAIWDVRTRRTDEGWVAEFAIPFKSLSFPAGRTSGASTSRAPSTASSRTAAGRAARLETQFLQVSEAGRDHESRGADAGHRPRRAPVPGRHAGCTRLATTRDSQRQARARRLLQRHAEPEADGDVQHRLRRDRGGRPPDQPVALLAAVSREAVVLPRRAPASSASPARAREPAGGIPGAGADVYPFFSRQIGLLGGQEVPLDVGVKLTGTVGRTDIGVLDVRTGDLAPFADEKNFFVGRVKRNLLQQSYVGRASSPTALRRAARIGRTYGADLRLATSRFLGGSRNFVVNAYGRSSVNDGPLGRRLVVRVLGELSERPSRRARSPVARSRRTSSPRSASCSATTSACSASRAASTRGPQNFLNIQQMFHDVYYTQFTRLDNGQVESWDLYVTALDWHFQVRRQLPRHARLQPDLRAPLRAVRDLARRRPACRASTASRASGRTSSPPPTARRRLGKSDLTWGNYWSGTAEQVTRQPHLQAAARASRQPEHEPDVRAICPEGDFTARIVTLERELRGVAAAVVLEPDSVRQPLAQSRLAEPCALDAHARERSVCGVQPGLGARRRGRSAFSSAG